MGKRGPAAKPKESEAELEKIRKELGIKTGRMKSKEEWLQEKERDKSLRGSRSRNLDDAINKEYFDYNYAEVLYCMSNLTKQVLNSCCLSSNPKSLKDIYDCVGGVLQYGSRIPDRRTILSHLEDFPKNIIQRVKSPNSNLWNHTRKGSLLLPPICAYVIDWELREGVTIDRILGSRRSSNGEDYYRRVVTLMKLAKSSTKVWKIREIAKIAKIDTYTLRKDFLRSLAKLNYVEILEDKVPSKTKRFSWNKNRRFQDALGDRKAKGRYPSLADRIIKLFSSVNDVDRYDLGKTLEVTDTKGISLVLSGLEKKDYLTGRRGYDTKVVLKEGIKKSRDLFSEIDGALNDPVYLARLGGYLNDVKDKAQRLAALFQ